MNPTNKVQTRVTFEEWWGASETACLRPQEANAAKMAWNAALDSVILSEGKRFEVGDRARRFFSGTIWTYGTILFVPDGVYEDIHGDYKVDLRPRHGDIIESFPQTVELTTTQKRVDLMNRLVTTGTKLSQLDAMAFIIEAMDGGKTLDQLCAEYNVLTTREV